MKKTIIIALCAFLIVSSQVNATYKTSTTHDMGSSIVIRPRVMIRGDSDSANVSREILKSHPLLSDSTVFEYAKKYLESTLKVEVKDKVHFYRWLHTDEWTWPISKDTLVIQIDYMVNSIQVDGKSIAVGTMAFQPMFPLFEDQSDNDKYYKVSGRSYPPVVFAISDDSEKLSLALQRAMEELFQNYGSGLTSK